MSGNQSKREYPAKDAKMAISCLSADKCHQVSVSSSRALRARIIAGQEKRLTEKVNRYNTTLIKKNIEEITIRQVSAI